MEHLCDKILCILVKDCECSVNMVMTKTCKSITNIVISKLPSIPKRILTINSCLFGDQKLIDHTDQIINTINNYDDCYELDRMLYYANIYCNNLEYMLTKTRFQHGIYYVINRLYIFDNKDRLKSFILACSKNNLSLSNVFNAVALIKKEKDSIRLTKSIIDLAGYIPYPNTRFDLALKNYRAKLACLFAKYVDIRKALHVILRNLDYHTYYTVIIIVNKLLSYDKTREVDMGSVLVEWIDSCPWNWQPQNHDPHNTRNKIVDMLIKHCKRTDLAYAFNVFIEKIDTHPRGIRKLHYLINRCKENRKGARLQITL